MEGAGESRRRWQKKHIAVVGQHGQRTRLQSTPDGDDRQPHHQHHYHDYDGDEEHKYHTRPHHRHSFRSTLPWQHLRRKQCSNMPATTDEDDEYISDTRSIGSPSGSSHDSADDDNRDDDDDEGDDDWPAQPLSQHFFAPPFYGRPPTPLPPSPSLTSLLRPSRPTTPDASDDDEAPMRRWTRRWGDTNNSNNNTNNNNNNGNGISNGDGGDGQGDKGGRGRRYDDDAPPPTVPTYEYYGFVLYLFSSLAFLTYLLWSYLPKPFLHALGVYYFPDRWWALAVPSFLVMSLCYIYVALAAYNTEVLTVPLASVGTIVDGAGRLALIDSKGRLRYGATAAAHHQGQHDGAVVALNRDSRDMKRDKDGRFRWREIWNEGTDAVLDIPLGGVCEVLYGEDREQL